VDAVRARWRRHAARLGDFAYVGCGLVITGGTTVALLDGGREITALWVCAVNLALTAALLWRRRFPILITAAAVPAAVVASGQGLLTLAIFALAIRRRDRALVLAAVVGIAAFAAGAIVAGSDPFGATFSACFVIGSAVGFGAFVGARRDLVASLRERAERAEAEQHLRTDQARLSERARIAQEMHDVLAHKISLVALHAGGLEVRPDAGPEQVERAAGLIRITAREALEDLRGVLGVLRNDTSGDGVALVPQPRLDDVPALVEASVRAGVPVTLQSDLPVGAVVPELTGRTAYRVVQEALTNVHKHARGTATTVSMSGGPGEGLSVTVRNLQPVGTELTPLLPGSGMGLLGLGERVRLVGGQFTAGPDGDAFVVRASLPWPTADGSDTPRRRATLGER
jgi:signal transduction histidine kinase